MRSASIRPLSPCGERVRVRGWGVSVGVVDYARDKTDEL
jgi:hypothetical protein